MIVWNEFLTDARVLKEAQTLINAGHNVTVHAIHTPNKTKQTEVLDRGVRVVRVSRNPLWGIRERLGLRKKRIVQKPTQTQHSLKRDSTSTAEQSKPKKSLLKFILKPFMRAYTHMGLCWALIKSKPDVIHAHDVNTLIVAWIASRVRRVPLVYDAHEISTSREGYQSIRNLVGCVEKFLMPKAIATITTTEMRAKFFARAYGVPRPTVLQNRPSYFELRPSNKIRHELGLNNTWPIVVYQGGLQPGRGLERLIRAAQHVSDVYIVLIGSGRLASHLRCLSEELGVTEKVKFIPVVPLAQLPEYTASADVGVQPILNTCLNHYSTDSNKLFEYVLAGLPVIATSFPEIRRIVQEYQVGILTNETVDELATAINLLKIDANLRQKFQANCIKVREGLSWESQEEALVKLYESIKSS